MTSNASLHDLDMVDSGSPPERYVTIELAGLVVTEWRIASHAK